MDPITTTTTGPSTGQQTKAPTPTEEPKSAGASLAADFDTFLKMLTAQMQNQDPLNPLDSTDFATQLATFSGVEQQIRTNELIETLGSQLGANGIADLAGWVGMEAKSAAPVGFDGAPITLAPDVPARAERAEIVVRTKGGGVIERLPVAAGTDTIAWAGTTPGGRPYGSGVYEFTLEATVGGEKTSRPIEAYQRVREARLTDEGTALVFASGVTATAEEVTALRERN